MPMKVMMSSVPIFQFLVAEDIPKLQGICRVLSKSTGDAILLYGEPVLGMYIVGEGSVGVYPLRASRPLVTLSSGEAFGEMSFLEKSRASATIRAEEDQTRLAIIPHADLAQLLDAEPRVGYALYQGIALTLSTKLRLTNEKIAAELAKGNALIGELATQSGTEAHADLSETIQGHTEGILASLQEVAKKVNDLGKLHPERVGSFAEMDQQLNRAKSHAQAFVPHITESVRMMAGFIRSMEAFIQESLNR